MATELLIALGKFLTDSIVWPPLYIYCFISDLFAYVSEHPISWFFSDTFYHAYEHPLFWFFTIFIFRYFRLVVHCISFWAYKPTPILENPTITPQDCTIIIPTVDSTHFEFKECLQSVLLNRPKQILIVTVGDKDRDNCIKLIQLYKSSCPATEITVLVSPKANKRIQVSLAIQKVRTKISALVDDHVLWGRKFLRTALAPFEDPQIGAVGTNKCVRKEHTGFNKLSYWNMLGALYLERHNFEIRATNTIDGGVFVISGRTSLHRTEILQDPAFLPGFTNEKFFFGLFGPLNADDDNYITRFAVSHGWKIKIQYSDDACIETTLGAYPKFVSQCLRWVRTTWRSNSASLFTDRTVWRRQPWCVYAVYITSFFNFALFHDAGLACLLWKSEYGTLQSLAGLGGWIFATKMVKLWPYFRRYPEDLRMLLGYFAFAYFHSLIKGYAMFTFWNCHWGGRDLDAISKAAAGNDKPSDDRPETTKPEENGPTGEANIKAVVEAADKSLNLSPRATVRPLFGEGIASSNASSDDEDDNAGSSKLELSLKTPIQIQGSTTTPPAPLQKHEGLSTIAPSTPSPRTAQTFVEAKTTSATPSPRQYKGYKKFTPPPNISQYHLHGSPPKIPTGLSGISPPPVFGPLNSQISKPTSSDPFNNSPFNSEKSPIPTRNSASPTPQTEWIAPPCKHCFEHRCLAVLLILIWLSTIVLHYLIANGKGVFGTPMEVPRDWARGTPSVETFGFGRV